MAVRLGRLAGVARLGVNRRAVASPRGPACPVLVALAGGVGAARFLQGAVRVAPAHRVVAVVNTGDDLVLHGLHVSPDVDTVTYTLAGAVAPDQGWGLQNDSWAVMSALDRFRAAAPAGSQAGTTWFRLGDRDLATHLYRTQRLSEGARLSEVMAEIGRAWRLDVRLLPMSDDRVETRMEVEGEGEISFQEYFVERRHAVTVTGVRYAGAERATPAPGVLDAIEAADVVVVCPSNPIVSIGPILAVPGISEAVTARRDRVVAVSPIVAGAALKGPAARLLAELGHEASVVGVARLYAPLAATLVVDAADAALAPEVEAAGMRCVVAPTVMHGVIEAKALAHVVLTAGLRGPNAMAGLRGPNEVENLRGPNAVAGLRGPNEVENLRGPNEVESRPGPNAVESRRHGEGTP